MVINGLGEKIKDYVYMHQQYEIMINIDEMYKKGALENEDKIAYLRAKEAYIYVRNKRGKIKLDAINDYLFMSKQYEIMRDIYKKRFEKRSLEESDRIAYQRAKEDYITTRNKWTKNKRTI